MREYPTSDTKRTQQEQGVLKLLMNVIEKTPINTSIRVNNQKRLVINRLALHLLSFFPFLTPNISMLFLVAASVWYTALVFIWI